MSGIFLLALVVCLAAIPATTAGVFDNALPPSISTKSNHCGREYTIPKATVNTASSSSTSSSSSSSSSSKLPLLLLVDSNAADRTLTVPQTVVQAQNLRECRIRIRSNLAALTKAAACKNNHYLPVTPRVLAEEKMTDALPLPDNTFSIKVQTPTETTADWIDAEGDEILPVPAAGYPRGTNKNTLFEYYLDTFFRVVRVEGAARRPDQRTNDHFGSDTFLHYCNALASTESKTDAVLKGRPMVICGDKGQASVDKGHIVALELGGSNDDPINLMPQWSYSNQNGGRWRKIESIAQFLVKEIEDCADMQVDLAIFLSYSSDTNLVPSGGYYIISPSEQCADAITNYRSNSAYISSLQATRFKDSNVPLGHKLKEFASQNCGDVVCFGTQWSNSVTDSWVLYGFGIPDLSQGGSSSTPAPMVHSFTRGFHTTSIAPLTVVADEFSIIVKYPDVNAPSTTVQALVLSLAANLQQRCAVDSDSCDFAWSRWRQLSIDTEPQSAWSVDDTTTLLNTFHDFCAAAWVTSTECIVNVESVGRVFPLVQISLPRMQFVVAHPSLRSLGVRANFWIDFEASDTVATFNPAALTGDSMVQLLTASGIVTNVAACRLIDDSPNDRKRSLLPCATPLLSNAFIEDVESKADFWIASIVLELPSARFGTLDLPFSAQVSCSVSEESLFLLSFPSFILTELQGSLTFAQIADVVYSRLVQLQSLLQVSSSDTLPNLNKMQLELFGTAVTPLATDTLSSLQLNRLHPLVLSYSFPLTPLPNDRTLFTLKTCTSIRTMSTKLGCDGKFGW